VWLARQLQKGYCLTVKLLQVRAVLYSTHIVMGSKQCSDALRVYISTAHRDNRNVLECGHAWCTSWAVWPTRQLQRGYCRTVQVLQVRAVLL
jgi:hypothetical protein